MLPGKASHRKRHNSSAGLTIYPLGHGDTALKDHSVQEVRKLQLLHAICL